MNLCLYINCIHTGGFNLPNSFRVLILICFIGSPCRRNRKKSLQIRGVDLFCPWLEEPRGCTPAPKAEQRAHVLACEKTRRNIKFKLCTDKAVNFVTVLPALHFCPLSNVNQCVMPHKSWKLK